MYFWSDERTIPEELTQLLTMPGLPNELREEITKAHNEIAMTGAVKYPTKTCIENYLHKYHDQIMNLDQDNQYLESVNETDNQREINTDPRAVWQKPKYFFVAFGEPDEYRPRVESRRYPHEKGYISNRYMKPGDVALLYCTEKYVEYCKQAPGIGIITGTETGGEKEEFYYQYFPFTDPVEWETIQENIFELKDCTRFEWRGNWLREISSASFRKVLDNVTINWP